MLYIPSVEINVSKLPDAQGKVIRCRLELLPDVRTPWPTHAL